MSRTVLANAAHAVALILYALILALLVLTTFWPAPVEGASIWVLLSVKLVPLLVFAPGLLRARSKTYQWLCFVILIYFTDAIMRAYLTGYQWPPTLMAALCAGLFIFAIIRIRTATPKQKPQNITSGSQHAATRER